MSAGRPSEYTPERGAEICRLIAEGYVSREIVKMEGMPGNWSTVIRWLHANPEFQERYARARVESAEALEAEALERVRSAAPEEAASARVLLDAMKWAASKRNPKVFGDKITHAGDSDAPLTIAVRRIVSTS